MNNDIKLEMVKANLKQYQLAQLLGIHEGSLSKMLNRKELTEDQKEKIKKIINKRRKNNEF